MIYDVTKEVEEISELKGITLEDAFESLNIYKIIDGEVFAGNRSEQNRVLEVLEQAGAWHCGGTGAITNQN